MEKKTKCGLSCPESMEIKRQLSYMGSAFWCVMPHEQYCEDCPLYEQQPLSSLTPFGGNGKTDGYKSSNNSYFLILNS
ncbi:MAG: hypothetical protein E7070_05135 [Bacteroidales bacterium]|nr:hypothetical protein [Bacteroidales bacterium]